MTTPAPKEYYYADAEGQPAGPHTPEILRELRHKEILSDETWVIEVGGTEWIAYHTLGASVTVPPVPPETKRSTVIYRRLITFVIFFLLFGALFLAATLAAAGAFTLHQAGTPITVDALQQNAQTLVWQNGAPTQNGYIFLGGSLFAALIVAGLLSFTNALPWCRQPSKRLAKR